MLNANATTVTPVMILSTVSFSACLIRTVCATPPSVCVASLVLNAHVRVKLSTQPSTGQSSSSSSSSLIVSLMSASTHSMSTSAPAQPQEKNEKKECESENGTKREKKETETFMTSSIHKSTSAPPQHAKKAKKESESEEGTKRRKAKPSQRLRLTISGSVRSVLLSTSSLATVQCKVRGARPSTRMCVFVAYVSAITRIYMRICVQGSHCHFCSNPLLIWDTLVLHPCNHVVDAGCRDEWVKYNRSQGKTTPECPLCRREIKKRCVDGISI